MGEPELAWPAPCFPPAEPSVEIFESCSAASREVELLEAHFVAGEDHPSGEGAAAAGEQYPASLRVEAAGEGIDCRGDVAGVDRGKRESCGAAGVGDRDPAVVCCSGWDCITA